MDAVPDSADPQVRPPPGLHPLGHRCLVGSSEVGKWESSRFVPLFQRIPAALGPLDARWSVVFCRTCGASLALHGRCAESTAGLGRCRPRRTQPLRPGVMSLPPHSRLLTASTSCSFQSVNVHLFRYSFLSMFSPLSSHERNCFPGFLSRWLICSVGKDLTSCSPFPSSLSRLLPCAGQSARTSRCGAQGAK